jgi:hypothetical protein
MADSTSTTPPAVAPATTPARLWKKLSLPHRQRVASAFWQADDAVDDQVQAALLIAQQKKFRPKSVLALDDERKARHLASMPSVPEQVAARALVAYHLDTQRPMMGAFLDALGIKHENGVIQEDDVKPDEAKLATAVDAIEKTFPVEDVALYLNVLVCQDPGTWSALGPIVEKKGW